MLISDRLFMGIKGGSTLLYSKSSCTALARDTKTIWGRAWWCLQSQLGG